MLKFIYSEKATKVCEISTLLLFYVVPVKNKLEISQNFLAFSEYTNFTSLLIKSGWMKKNLSVNLVQKKNVFMVFGQNFANLVIVNSQTWNPIH